jgi:hypothetical protein
MTDAETTERSAELTDDENDTEASPLAARRIWKSGW